VNLRLRPIGLDEANAFVARHHRHSKPTQGHKFSVGVMSSSGLCGVGIAGRPIARQLDDGFTIEILRVCTDGTRNACTKLYAACCRAAGGMGYIVAVTYTLATESGSSLRASGFREVAAVKDEQWSRESRPRLERDLVGGRIRWERLL